MWLMISKQSSHVFVHRIVSDLRIFPAMFSPCSYISPDWSVFLPAKADSLVSERDFRTLFEPHNLPYISSVCLNPKKNCKNSGWIGTMLLLLEDIQLSEHILRSVNVRHKEPVTANSHYYFILVYEIASVIYWSLCFCIGWHCRSPSTGSPSLTFQAMTVNWSTWERSYVKSMVICVIFSSISIVDNTCWYTFFYDFQSFVYNLHEKELNILITSKHPK